MCNFLGSVLLQQKSETTDQHYSLQTGQCYSSWTDQCHSSQMDQCYSSMLQLSFIWIIKENTSLRCEGMLTQKPRKEEQGWGGGERDPQPFDSSFYMIFLLPLGLPCVNWASQECCVLYPRSSDICLFYFCKLYPYCLLASAILNSFFLL